MIVWMPSVSRTVNLHTALQLWGVIVYVFRDRPGKVTPRSPESSRNLLPTLCNLPLTAHQLASARDPPWRSPVGAPGRGSGSPFCRAGLARTAPTPAHTAA